MSHGIHGRSPGSIDRAQIDERLFGPEGAGFYLMGKPAHPSGLALFLTNCIHILHALPADQRVIRHELGGIERSTFNSQDLTGTGQESHQQISKGPSHRLLTDLDVFRITLPVIKRLHPAVARIGQVGVTDRSRCRLGIDVDGRLLRLHVDDRIRSRHGVH
jgi:hypothetical protein